jgi:photosystem II stability/assembly factor-like uncharacterized protein
MANACDDDKQGKFNMPCSCYQIDTPTPPRWVYKIGDRLVLWGMGLPQVFTSDDQGTTWNAADNVINPSFPIGFMDGRFFAFWSCPAPQKCMIVMSSIDGHTWKSNTLPINADDLQTDNIAVANKIWIAVTNAEDAAVISRDDGKTWSPLQLPAHPRDNGFFLASSSGCILLVQHITSPDLGGAVKEVVSRFIPESGDWEEITPCGCAFSAPRSHAASGSIFVVNPQGALLITTDGGSIWSFSPMPEPLFGIAVAGDVIVRTMINVDPNGKNRVLFSYSSDQGKTWNAPCQGLPNPLHGSLVGVGENRFFVVDTGQVAFVGPAMLGADPIPASPLQWKLYSCSLGNNSAFDRPRRGAESGAMSGAGRRVRKN